MRWTYVVALGIVASCSSGAAADDGAVVELDWAPGLVGDARGTMVELSSVVPPGLKLPKGVSAPFVARVPWGERGTLTVLLGGANRTLWMDRDLDGDLAEESMIARGPEGQRDVRQASVRTTPDSEAGAVEIEVAPFDGSDPPRVRLWLWMHRRGVGLVGDRVREISLVDANGDARFDGAGADVVHLDLDGDGTMAEGDVATESVPVGSEIRVGDEGYRVEVPAPDGRHVRFVRLAAAPPPPPRTWQPTPAPPAGVAMVPPKLGFNELRSEATQAERYRWRPALESLGALGTREAGAYLLSVARGVGNAERRAVATRALGNPTFLENRGADLVKLAKSAEPAIAIAAIEALHAMGHPARDATLVELVATAKEELLASAALHLAYVGTAAARDALLKAWHDPSRSLDRAPIYAAIRALPDGPTADLAAAATDVAGRMRFVAALDLFRLGDARARSAALALAPTSRRSNLACVRVLAAYADAECVRAILGTLRGKDDEYRQHVTKRLSTLRGGAAAYAILGALRHEAPEVRVAAAEVLGAVRPDGSLEVLRGCAASETDPSVLVALAESLGAQGDPRAAETLASIAPRITAHDPHAANRALARAAGASAEARKQLAARFASPTWGERVVLLDALEDGDDPSVAEWVTPNLRHAQRQVRLAAANALGRVRAAAAVGPLVDQLAAERDGDVRRAVAAALFRTTGVNLYDDATVWRRWWDANRDGFTVPATAPSRAPLAREGTTDGFYGLPVVGSRVVFLLDRSGSMSERDFRLAVEETLKAVGKMADGDAVEVMRFGTEVAVWRGRFAILNANTRQRLASHLRAQKPDGGSTNLYDAIERALSYDGVDAVYILSDGMPNEGRFEEDADIVRAVRVLNRAARAKIHAVAVGYRSALLRALAEEHGGVYVERGR